MAKRQPNKYVNDRTASQCSDLQTATRFSGPLRRRYRANSIIALRFVIFLFLSLSGPLGADESKDELIIQSEYEKGYAIGVEKAESEIHSNSMTYYTCGLAVPPTPGEGPRERYGLPIKHVCGVMDPTMSGVISGHNETIKEYLGVAQ